MSLNNTASADRVHIGFFGLRNAGKSSLVNAVTGQELAVVSDVKGTTTDPVKKAMELLPLGPVVIIDTPGIDDEGSLGEMRVRKARQVLNYTDIAVLVSDSTSEINNAEKELISLFKDKKIPYVIVYSKADLLTDIPQITENTIYVSAEKNINVNELKDMLATLTKNNENNKKIVSDLLCEGDCVVLVVPIDESAPKGRLILPQQQTIRDIIEAGATSVVCRDTELVQTLSMLAKKPKLVITDSQAFGRVSKDTPEDILLTSFSILFARYKGNLENAVRGAAQLDKLNDGDTVLISEGCTHHRQCNDIGTVKMLNWISNYTGKKLNFEFTSGTEFPEDVSKYSLIVHCGGCMLNEREMQYRMRHSSDCGVPMTNYGTAIAQMHGILKRSLSPFPEMLKIIE